MNLLQTNVMKIICDWCKTESQPITLDEIALKIGQEQASRNTLKATMRSLEKQGYVRKAIRTRKTSYVKMRGLNGYN